MQNPRLCRAYGVQDGPHDWRRFVLRTRQAAAEADEYQEPLQQARLVADVPAFLARAQDAILATGALPNPLTTNEC